MQNHDQVANSAGGLRCHAADQPGPLARDDGAAAAGAGHADAVPGPGVRAPRARSSTSPTTRRSWPSWSREGRAEFLAQFPQPRRRRRCRRALADPATRRRSSAASSTSAERRDGTRRLCACTATCSAAPRGPGASARRPARRGRRGARAEAFVLRFFGGRRPTTGCCSSTSAAICTLDPAPEPLLAPPEGHGWEIALVERGRRATAAAARRRSTREETGASRARRRSSWRLAPRRADAAPELHRRSELASRAPWTVP